MDWLGFRCWVERPYAEEELASDELARATVGLNRALGTEVRKTVRSFYVDSRREAREWALEEYKTAKAVVAEARA